MFDIIRKTMLAGVGFATVTKDKFEELAKEFIAKGELTEKEGKKLVAEYMKKSEQARKTMEKNLEELIQKSLNKMNIASQKDIARLEAKIKQLERKKTSKTKKATESK